MTYEAARAVQRIYDLAQEHDANTGLIPVSEILNALGVESDGTGLEKLTGIQRPTDSHAAVYLDDHDQLWAEYPSVPHSDTDTAILPLVWASEQCQSKEEMEDQGTTFRLIGWSQ